MIRPRRHFTQQEICYLVAMNRLYQLSAAVIYIVLFFLLFPWYQYILDIDAISYIHVAERFAKGEYYYSVNGYWSPLISWILVPFINAGFDPVFTAKYINGLLGLLTLFSCYSLIDKFTINHLLKRILPFVLAVLLLSYAFYELCADLLQLFLLLLYINLIFSNDFIHTNGKIILAGVLGAFCYFAKAYNFPFFLLHFLITLFVLVKKNYPVTVMRSFIKKAAVGLIAFFLLVTPYLVVLTHKYGSFRINNAGRLNLSWFLSAGTNDHRRMVAEPPFPDATSYWDEPTYSQEKYVGPFTSVGFFLKQIKLTISNSIKFSGLLNQVTIFVYVILVGFLFYLYRKKRDWPVNENLLLFTTLLYPVGYLLIFIEWRYIWLLPVTILLMAAVLLTWLSEQQLINKGAFIVLAFIVPGSFLLQPVNELQDLRKNNEDVYEMAAIFKAQNIKGNFFLNYKSFVPYAKTVVLCYLTGSKLYGPAALDYNFEELMQSVDRYHINYYLFFYDFPSEKEIFLQSPYARAGIKIFDNLYPGLIVVQFK